jgi:hypothetical protein
MQKHLKAVCKMKKLLINIVCFFVTFSVFAQNTDAVLPEILLPEIDINIQDMKEIHVDTLEDSGEFLNIELDPLVKPEITQSIKVDLEKTLPPQEASRETPALDAGFSNSKNLVWIEKEIPVAPVSGATLKDIYKHIYLAIREGVPFPVKNSEAFEVARVTQIIRDAANQ